MSNFDFKHKLTQVDSKPHYHLNRKEKAIKTSLDISISILLLMCAIILASDFSEMIVEKLTIYLFSL